MTTITESKETIAIKPEVREVADYIKSNATMDKETGVGSATPEVYANLLSKHTSISAEQVKELQKLNTTFVAAAHLANGELSLDVLKSNKNIDQTEMRIPMVARDAFELTFHRSKEVSAGNRENPAERKTIYGVSRGGFEIHAEGNRGELSKVKTYLASQAAELFS